MSTSRALIGCVTAVAACAALTASCGGGSARHVGGSASTTTSTPIATTTTTPPVTYQVKRGDTLTMIAKQFRVSVSTIVAFNQIAQPDRLTEGQNLRIPPAPPLNLVITPRDGLQGEPFQLKLTGARPSERVTFEVDSPAGKFTGPPHTASADGAVTATYQSSLEDPPGAFTVIAHGNAGTTVRARFVLLANPDHT